MSPRGAPFDSRWPEGAGCVACITVDFDGPSVEVGNRHLPIGARSHGRYAAKCGIPRYLDMLGELGIAATFFVPGYDAECHPEVVRQIAAAGFEVGAHGYLHEGWDVGDAEPELLAKTHRILTDVIGEMPRGWRSPSGRKSSLTIRTLRSLGYVYDSSDKDTDLPTFPALDGVVLDDFVSLPNNTSSLDDFSFYRVSFTPAGEVALHWEQEFAAIHAEGGYFNLTVHPARAMARGRPCVRRRCAGSSSRSPGTATCASCG